MLRKHLFVKTARITNDELMRYVRARFPLKNMSRVQTVYTYIPTITLRDNSAPKGSNFLCKTVRVREQNRRDFTQTQIACVAEITAAARRCLKLFW